MVDRGANPRLALSIYAQSENFSHCFMLFRLSKDWAIYTGISFLSCLATILPITRFGISLLIAGYAFYGVAHVFIAYSNIEKSGDARDKKAMNWALSYSAPDFIFLLISIVAGIYLGVHH